MADNHDKEGKTRKEKINQNPDPVDDKDKKPLTPEPPQRKHPLAKPEHDEEDKKS